MIGNLIRLSCLMEENVTMGEKEPAKKVKGTKMEQHWE